MYLCPPCRVFGSHRESLTNLTYEDIPDLSDDDRIDGEEPLLESMAAARRGGTGAGTNFPITVTSSARSRGGLSGDHSPSPSSFGMTLEQYMLEVRKLSGQCQHPV